MGFLTPPMRTDVRAKCALGKFASRNSFLVRRFHNLHLFPSFHTTRARPRGRPSILKTLLLLMLRIANYRRTKRILANLPQALAFLFNTSFCQEKEILRWFGDLQFFISLLLYCSTLYFAPLVMPKGTAIESHRLSS